ncbi:osmotically inducible protein C [Brevundimonas sp. GN22]|uniref:OsmC family protein n=1 Tax=Brevundimonas pishanensis TaxID=2896315 RepID=UPI001FA7B556|nr:OsmC family protein [Brevundimonas pishanensis]
MAIAHAKIGNTPYRTEIRSGAELEHVLIADEPSRLGGANDGPAPFDLLISALGACTAITLKMYAEKKGWPLQSLDVKLEYKGSDGSPRIDRILVPQGDLDETQLARLADVAERTPVTLAIKNGVPVHTTLQSEGQ